MYRRAIFWGNKICDRSAKFLAEVQGEKKTTSIGLWNHQQMGVSENSGTPKTPQNDHF